MSSSEVPHILTFDVEDNFTRGELSKEDDWYRYEKQVVENTKKVLSIVERYDATATFFVVGEVADRHPDLVVDIAKRGHEIASHSYSHKPYRNMSMEDIKVDIERGVAVLNSLCDDPITGFRAMGFSIPDDRDTFHRLLMSHGIRYDSSSIHSPSGRTIEQKSIAGRNLYQLFPSHVRLLNRRLIFSGGTYLRVLPMPVIQKGFREYSAHNEPVLVYAHPWEFNRDQPKRNVSLKQKVLQSPLTYTTQRKLQTLLARHKFISIRDFLKLL